MSDTPDDERTNGLDTEGSEDHDDGGDGEETQYLTPEEVPEEAVVLQAGEVLLDGEGVIGRIDPRVWRGKTPIQRGESE